MGFINRIKERHDLPLLAALSYEVFVRLYQVRLFRFFAKGFFCYKEPKGWIFLVGCYNAGTTIVKDAIAAHPEVSRAPVEGDVLTGDLSTFESDQWPRCLIANWYDVKIDRAEHYIDYGSVVSDWAPWIKQDNYYIEKSIANSVRVKALSDSFPKAKFVCVYRHPDEVIDGILKRSRPGKCARKILGSNSYPRELLLRQWAYVYQLIISDMGDSDHILYVSYDGFLSNPDIELGRIYDFLGLAEIAISFESNQLHVDGRHFAIRPGGVRSIDEGTSNLDELRSEVQSTMDRINNGIGT